MEPYQTLTLNMVLVHYYYYCTLFYSKSYHNRMAMKCNAGTTITVTTSDLKHLLFPGSCVPSLIPHSHFPWFLLSSYLNLILRKMIYSPSEKPKISVSLLLLIYIIHHSAPEQWPREKKTSTSKINPNESVLLLYIDIW